MCAKCGLKRNMEGRDRHVDEATLSAQVFFLLRLLLLLLNLILILIFVLLLLLLLLLLLFLLLPFFFCFIFFFCVLFLNCCARSEIPCQEVRLENPTVDVLCSHISSELLPFWHQACKHREKHYLCTSRWLCSLGVS